MAFWLKVMQKFLCWSSTEGSISLIVGSLEKPHLVSGEGESVCKVPLGVHQQDSILWMAIMHGQGGKFAPRIIDPSTLG